MASAKKPTSGLTFTRKYTRDDITVFQFDYDYRTSVIRNPCGEVISKMNNGEGPILSRGSTEKHGLITVKRSGINKKRLWACEFTPCQKNVFAQPMHTIHYPPVMQFFSQHLSTAVHISGLFFSACKSTFVKIVPNVKPLRQQGSVKLK